MKKIENEKLRITYNFFYKLMNKFSLHEIMFALVMLFILIVSFARFMGIFTTFQLPEIDLSNSKCYNGKMYFVDHGRFDPLTNKDGSQITC